MLTINKVGLTIERLLVNVAEVLITRDIKKVTVPNAKGRYRTLKVEKLYKKVNNACELTGKTVEDIRFSDYPFSAYGISQKRFVEGEI